MPNRTALPPTGHAAWDQLADWWLTRYKPATRRLYAGMLPRWTAWCGQRGIDPLTARRPDVEMWLQLVADSGFAPATVAAHYDAVASIYRLAFDEELIERNPCARIARPKVHRELQHREVLSVLEYAAFLVARQLGPTEHAIAVLAGMMGLRASEMAGLQVESVTTVRGFPTITFIGKGDKPARVPVPMPALPAIQAVIDGRTTGPLLRRVRSGGPLDRRAVHAYVARIAKAAGINRPIGPHALRRTVGTAALNQGVPLRDVQKLLRHSRPETTISSYDMGGDGLERHASHQVAGFLAGFAS